MDIQRLSAGKHPVQPEDCSADLGLPHLHHTERLAQWIALIAELMLLVVWLRYLLVGEITAAIVTGMPLVMIVTNHVALIAGRDWPIPPYVILMTFATAQLTLAYVLSNLVIIWAFPTLVGAFLIAGTKHVHIYAVIMLMGGAVIAHLSGNTQFAIRFLPAFAGMWMFLYILFQVMHGLRINAWRQSIIDPLTGAYNRRYLDLYMEDPTKKGRAAMLLFDMDRFKQLNDKEGHVAGDRALRRLVRLVQGNWASEVVCFRLGGDEFVLLLKLPARTRDQMSLLEQDRHLSQLGQKISDVLNRDGTFSVSGGLVHFGWPSDLDDIYRRADAALYMAKDHGRGRLCIGESVPQPSQSQPMAPILAENLPRQTNTPL